MTTPEEIAKQMEEWSEFISKMKQNSTPFRIESQTVVSQLATLREELSKLLSKWRVEYLEVCDPPDQNNDLSQHDFEDYSKPIIVPTEMIRMSGFTELAHRIYRHVVAITDEHCEKENRNFHRGALYANLGITYFELDQFELGLSWLLAAAKQDVDFGRVEKIEDSYALSDEGIYGQWITSTVVSALPEDVISFVKSKVNIQIETKDVMKLFRMLAGSGDLSLLRGIVQYQSVDGRNDDVSHTVRFICLRELSTLFEVLCKKIGINHVDPDVKAKFEDSPMLGNIIHCMHYNNHQYAAGLFWNNTCQQEDELEAVKTGFDFVKNFKNNNITEVWDYLDQTTFLDPAKSDAEEVGKRILLSYRLRNLTSHSFTPQDTGMVDHADDFRTWLLQSIFYMYFWVSETNQTNL